MQFHHAERDVYERGSIAHQYAFLKQVRRQLDARGFQARDKRGANAGRFVLPVGSSVLVDAELLEAEDLLHDDDIAFHAEHFTERGDLARHGPWRMDASGRLYAGDQ